MALIVTDDVTQEANAILAASNAFDVLGISPSEFSPVIVKLKHDEKVQRFKRHFRNKTVTLAKNRVDEAKMRLLDDRLREKELHEITLKVQKEAAEREEMHQLEDWTRYLETKASVIVQRNKLRLDPSFSAIRSGNCSSKGTSSDSSSAIQTTTSEATIAGVKRNRDECSTS